MDQKRKIILGPITISKAMMDCTWLRNKFLKNRSAENKFLAYIA